METFDWQSFLERYSRELLADRQIRAAVSQRVVRSAWMGFAPATPGKISRLERRIRAELPESYKQFLATSNGWRHSGRFICELLPCAKVEWFRTDHQDWIDAYLEPAKGEAPLSIEEHCVYGDEQEVHRFRIEYLQSTLQISGVGDSSVYLLNPEVRTSSGEWEAWFFANWYPGAARYRSFWDLMEAECRSAINLRESSEARFFPEDGIETLQLKLPGLSKELAEKAKGHSLGKQQRASRGRVTGEAYTDGIIQALSDSEAAVKRIAALKLSPEEILSLLTDLAEDLHRQWQANVRPGSSRLGKRDGQAEGNREAAGIIRWFLNQPQS